MTFVALPTPTPYPDARAWGATGRLTFTQTVLDAAGEKVGWIIKMPIASTITKVGFRIGAVVAAQSLDVRVELVSATTGLPTGTLWASAPDTSGALASPNADTWYWVTLTAGAVVAIGDVIAIVLQWTSTVGNLEVSASYGVGAGGNVLGHESGLPYGVQWTTGAWNKMASIPINVALEMSNGSRPHVSTLPIADAVLFSQWGAAADYNEKGNKFSLPFSCKISGAMVRISTGGASIFDISLYDASGYTILARVYAIDSDWMAPNLQNIEPATAFYFSSEITLNAYETYRLVAVPQPGQLAITVEDVGLDDRDTLHAWPGGTSFSKTERKDESSAGTGPFGPWDVNILNVSRRMFIYPIISAIDDGSGITTTPRLLGRREFAREADPLFGAI